MDTSNPTFLEFKAYWQLSEEMIADATKEDIAEVARILAMQAAHYARQFGELPIPDLAHLLSSTTVDDELQVRTEGAKNGARSPVSTVRSSIFPGQVYRPDNTNYARWLGILNTTCVPSGGGHRDSEIRRSNSPMAYADNVITIANNMPRMIRITTFRKSLTSLPRSSNTERSCGDPVRSLTERRSRLGVSPGG